MYNLLIKVLSTQNCTSKVYQGLVFMRMNFNQANEKKKSKSPKQESGFWWIGNFQPGNYQNTH